MDRRDKIKRYENRLRAALLAGDADELDRLLSDECVFTDQNGRHLTKAEDLAVHRSGLLKIGRVEAVGEQIVRVLDETAVVCVTLELAGHYAGEPFGGTFAYSRVWRRSGAAWRIELAHCSAASHDG